MKHQLFLFILTAFVFQATLSAQVVNQYDKEGRQHGKWVKYHAGTEVIRYTGQFENGIPTGEFKYYYATGKLRTIATYEKNGTVCYTVSYFGNGNKHAEGNYINKLKDGKWLFYDGYNNIIAIDYYLKDKKQGVCTTFLQTGEKIEEITFNNDIPNGRWVRYYKNGKMQFEGSLENDNWQGSFVFYNLDGSKIASGKYEQNLRIGDWIFYDEEGKMIKVVTYKNGREASKKVFQKEKDQDYIDQKEMEKAMMKIKSGQHDGEPDNPFSR
jgi:antitoxin component YwqK of YwqJK toxin-antitoxin module